MQGTIVKKISDKGYGFIQVGKKEYFFHSSACNGFYNELAEGDDVEFELGDSPKGPRAESVKLIDS